MELKLIENLSREEWENFLIKLPLGGEMLQSPVWQKISQNESYQSHLFAWEESNKIVALAQVLEKKIFFGSFWYLPRGPVFSKKESGKYGESLCLAVIGDLEKKAESLGVMAIRFEPSNVGEINYSVFGKRIKAIQPKTSLMLDLNKNENELLSSMHQKTRYNIRLAEKRGVEIERGDLHDLNLFYRMLKVTSKRDKFKSHSLAHYRKLLLHGQNKIELWLAKKDGKLLAAGLFSFYAGRASYLHGASANEGRRHMAPYLLQWTMIRRARSLKCDFYDFYGIDEKRWPGVTRFKLGFGGDIIEYPGAFISVIDKSRFWLYRAAVYIRRLLKV